MRIQHNIMAMSAYRNYTNNVSAMQKNLEKLSSGYKINRAGDDAAGLAISEKMRAQISGLEAAQKNAKDGISLVQTAEGALTEVHDMLNRMVTLATQSANGTYDDTTDRFQLQKEMDQLVDEINRIADSSNFNGIKLLDGSMDAGGDTTVTEGKFVVPGSGSTASVATGDIKLPTVGKTLGTNTVLHSEATEAVDTNEFSVELHNLKFSGAKDASFTMKIGDATFTYAQGGTAGDAVSAEDLAKAFVDADAKWTGGSIAAGKATINGVEYAVTAEGSKLTFKTTADVDHIPETVTIKDPSATEVAAVKDKYVTGAIGYTAGTTAAGDGAASVKVAYTDAEGKAQTKDVSFTVKTDDATTAANLIKALGDDTDLAKLFTVTGDETGISIEAKEAGEGKGAITGLTLTNAADAENEDQTSIGAKDTTNSVTGADAYTPDSNVTGDYNVSTTDITSKVEAGDARLASTHFTLTADMVTDGSTITIGTKTYTFTTDADKIGTEGYVDVTSGKLATIAEKLTDAVAENNTTYTLGTDTTAGHITITEKVGQKDFDLTTMKGIEKSLGFSKAVTTTKDDSKGLTLQIGDTAESFNQLKVSIKDMHAASLGLDKIKISDQDSAAQAVDVIKAAINKVSDVRGTLGATQNRLDHTINNLSVMTENIQDAESTIRDVDVAEEMMAYTKNSILIQSAQAMLAQANQIPQGVLQLLG